MMNPKVDNYLAEGCMRCKYGGTPQCKVHNWKDELRLLRKIVLKCGLIEEVKWGVPCYTFDTKNVLVVAAFNGYCSISFFKGALLSDDHRLLQKPGENTQSARLLKFTDVEEILEIEHVIESYIYESIEIEKAELKVEFKKKPEPLPEEFLEVLDKSPILKKAFFALTPGRQRGYILHFSQPKQAKTRVSRIGKNIDKILNGLGLNE